MAKSKASQPKAKAAAAPTAAAVSVSPAKSAVTTSVAPYSVDQLQTHLAEHIRCFDAMVELIPPKYYFAKIDVDADLVGKHLYNKKGKAPKQEIKDATKKAKKSKLDPESSQSVLEIQSDNLKAIAAQTTTTTPKAGGKSGTSAARLAPNGLAAPVIALPASSIGELQEKLKLRIQELRSKRKAAPLDEDGKEEAPKSRQEILEARATRKQERKAGIQLKKEKRRKLDDTTGMSTAPSPSKPAPSPSAGKKGSTVTEDVSFGKLDFGVVEPSKKRKGPTDIAGQLKQAEAKKQKLEKLKETNKEKAESIMESATWTKVLKQAEGEKVKDDVKLLKKSVKRKEATKQKSAAVWADRQASHKKEQDDRQKKREDNIKQRLEQRNAPKGSKAAKGGKPGGGSGQKKRPGFEGGARKKSTK
ncbi:surfeit locus protein [Thoreauomyces humboldtii]|nr:surfeit locus protein [Thoreauomyces humboldtii]